MKPVIIRNEHSVLEGAGGPGVRDTGIIQLILSPGSKPQQAKTQIIRIRHFTERAPVTITLDRSEFEKIMEAVRTNDRELVEGEADDGIRCSRSSRRKKLPGCRGVKFPL